MSTSKYGPASMPPEPATVTQDGEQPPAPHTARAQRRRRRPTHLVPKTFVGILLILQVYPLFWIVTTALKTQNSFASSSAFSLPTQITFGNFARAFREGDIPRFMLNSTIVTGASDVLIVVFGMMAAYAIHVLGFRFSRLMLAVLLAGIVIPVQAVLVPLFVDYSHIGLLNSYQSLVLPLVGFGLPISVYLFNSFYSYIPDEVYEAASLDGCGPYRMFWRITTPLSISTIVTVVFINSIFIWNDFIFANTFLLSQGLQTVPLGLNSYQGEMGATDWTAVFAAVCVTATPVLLAFLVLNRALLGGLGARAKRGGP